ncbi:MAG TPA: molybdopterin cofactor-binding domain-containing protein [Thermoanaerobaculia bacterium]|nr:molybdopterin cofactor-binding domain-containing protein [Thermoanaerobaculia bacterium]
MSERSGMDRRTFLKLMGEGIVVMVALGPTELVSQRRWRSYPKDINAYLLVRADGKVSVFTGKIEMGQGVMTSQAQMVADELDVALESIDIVMGDTDRCPWDMGTFGSLTTRMFGPVLRTAAAEARSVLMRLAAAKLGVKRDALQVTNGVVTVTGHPGETVTYGELTKGRRIVRLVGDSAVLKTVAQFKVMGRSPRRFDGPDKVRGEAVYAADVRLPGMLYARLVRPPAHGARLESVDTSEAEKLPGVKIVRDGDLIAVLHSEPDLAEAALARIRTKWEEPAEDLDPDSIFGHIEGAASTPEVREIRGDVRVAQEHADHLIKTTYRKGYVAHAPIEPHAATAEVKGGKVTVWASTQTPFPTHEDIARTLGVAADRVRVITPYVGGGFGGKSAHQQAVEAARLARLAGAPVQVAWLRDEEFFFDTFDPAAVVKITSAAGADGKMTLWDYRVYAAGGRGTEVFYNVQNARVTTYAGGLRGDESRTETHLHPFNVGPWRAPGANMNVFAKESQIDLMAEATGLDPVEFRLRNLVDPRMRRVLAAAAKTFGWKKRTRPRGDGRGQGVACGIDAGSYVALMAEVEVDRKSGAVHVERVTCAQEMGTIVNPNGAKMQMEGCVTMGLGYALTEELRFRGGRILDRNFGTYDLPRFSWVPRIETVLVPNDELAPQGGGEPAIVPMGGVIANAVFDATGARILRLPMSPTRVLAAIRAAQEAA